VLGDSITQFSLIIGIYLFALGAGAWLSRFVDKNLARCFIEVELGVAILGGVSRHCCSSVLPTSAISTWCFILLSLLWSAVGLELPLLMRILKEDWTSKI